MHERSHTRTPPVVRPAVRADIAALADALADAFADDPVMTSFVPTRRFLPRLTQLFRMDLGHHIRLGTTWAGFTSDGAAAGAALWAAPGRWKQGGLEIVRTLVPALGIFGHTLPRALRILHAMESAHPTEPHWYLATLGTATRAQGRGVGAAMLAPILTRCDRDATPAYLESSKPENLPFYERFGFRVTGEIALPGDCPPLIPMWRTPQALRND